MNSHDLVKGGQGRTADALVADAKTLVWLLALAVALVCGAALAEDDLQPQAQACVEKHSTKDAEAKWRAAWAARVAENERTDAASNEEQYAGRVLYDWLADRRGAFKKKELQDAEKLELCRWYLLFKEKRWSFPGRVREHLTVENFRAYIGAFELADGGVTHQ